MSEFLSRAKSLVPEQIKAPLRRLLDPQSREEPMSGYEHELGMFVLQQAEEFSASRGGRPEALHAECVRNAILHQKCLTQMNEASQFVQTAFMPDYERSLFDYYRLQQYLMLITFLSYPFRGAGCLRSHVSPFVVGASRLSCVRALDYGAGIPFGLIYLLQTCPNKVESITIVDLDLIHVELSEYILSRLSPRTELVVLRVIDAETVPDLGDLTFNLLYGKDIFEHVHDPGGLLRAILSNAAPSCIGYFDLRDHGAKYLQHVHPELSDLLQVIDEYSFAPTGVVAGLSGFARTAQPRP